MRKTRRLMRDVEKFEARQFREVGMSVKDCAAYFNVSIATLMRGLACRGRSAQIVPTLSEKWQAAKRPGVFSSSGGSSSAQMPGTWAMGQRG